MQSSHRVQGTRPPASMPTALIQPSYGVQGTRPPASRSRGELSTAPMQSSYRVHVTGPQASRGREASSTALMQSSCRVDVTGPQASRSREALSTALMQSSCRVDVTGLQASRSREASDGTSAAPRRRWFRNQYSTCSTLRPALALSGPHTHARVYTSRARARSRLPVAVAPACRARTPCTQPQTDEPVRAASASLSSRYRIELGCAARHDRNTSTTHCGWFGRRLNGFGPWTTEAFGFFDRRSFRLGLMVGERPSASLLYYDAGPFILAITQ